MRNSIVINYDIIIIVNNCQGIPLKLQNRLRVVYATIYKTLRQTSYSYYNGLSFGLSSLGIYILL